MRIGPYQVVEEIARGGMGVVYRARDPQGRDVALKLLQRVQDPRARKRFQNEVNALSRLRHPHVVPILAAGEQQGWPWLALEFVEGTSLQSRLHAGPLPIWEAIRVAQQLAQALSYVHSCGVLHRDLKPDNVLLRGPTALLTDFGLVLDDQSSHSRLTATGVFQGTPGYWAPEQARGEVREFGPRTDVYGLGTILYACLTGHAPVEADSLQEFLQTVRFRTTRPPHWERPETPEWLSLLCMRCLAPDPASRPASVEEVARALVLAAEHETPRAGPSRLALGLVALALGGLALLAVALRSRAREPVPPAEPAPAVASQDATAPLGEAAPALGEAAEAPRTDAAVEADAPGDEPAKASLEEALAIARGGDLGAALDRLSRLIEAYPNHAQAYFFRGHVKRDLQRNAEALQDYDRAGSLEPRNPLYRYWRGRAQADQGDLAGAIQDYDRTLDLDPDFQGALASRGSAKTQLGEHAAAITDLSAALALDPRDVPSWLVRGRARWELGDLDGALEDFGRAIALAPSDPITFGHRAMVCFKSGRWAEAVRDYTEVLKLLPDDVGTLWSRGNALRNLGRLDAAIADHTRALELDPRCASAYVGRGRAYLERGRNADAERDLDAALALGPEERQEALRCRAQAAQRLGRHAKALADCEALLKLDERDLTAFFVRGKVRAALGQHALAAEDFDRALEIDPTLHAAHAGRSKSVAILGRLDEAIRDLSRAIELEPLPDYVARRGSLLAMAGRFAEALRDLDRATELGVETAETWRMRGVAKAGLGRYEDALLDVSRAIELDPDDEVALHHRGLCLGQLGRHAEALAAHERTIALKPARGLYRYSRAKTLAALERYADALAACDEALELGLPLHDGSARELRAELTSRLEGAR